MWQLWDVPTLVGLEGSGYFVMDHRAVLGELWGRWTYLRKHNEPDLVPSSACYLHPVCRNRLWCEWGLERWNAEENKISVEPNLFIELPWLWKFLSSVGHNTILKVFQEDLLSPASQVLVGRCHPNRILVSWLWTGWSSGCMSLDVLSTSLSLPSFLLLLLSTAVLTLLLRRTLILQKGAWNGPFGCWIVLSVLSFSIGFRFQ